MAIIFVQTVTPFNSAPIREIPKYVFENCNQMTNNNYAEPYLLALKKAAETMTKECLETLCKQKPEGAFTKKAEELDWVFGLDTLEKELLSHPNPEMLLTAEKVIEWNGRFSRLLNKNPGKFRVEGIRWPKYQLNLAETACEPFIFNKLIKKLGSNIFETLSSSDGKKMQCVVSKETVISHINNCRNNIQQLQSPSTNAPDFIWKNLPDLKADVVHQWAKEQARDDGKIDLCKWVCDRYHFFPPGKVLAGELAASIEAIKDPKMDPIEKACRIWYDIIRLHISHEANKRTGKALGSVILLAYGYLPPKIGKEDAREYVDSLKYGFEKETGFEEFKQFVIRKVNEIQTEYKKL